MLKLRINPIVAKDLKNIRDYIAEDNEEYAAKTIKEIYGKFENLQMFPGMGSDLSKRVSFRTDYKYAIWEDYVIIYKIGKEYVCKVYETAAGYPAVADDPHSAEPTSSGAVYSGAQQAGQSDFL